MHHGVGRERNRDAFYYCDSLVKVSDNAVFTVMVCLSVRQCEQNARAFAAVFDNTEAKDSVKSSLDGFSFPVCLPSHVMPFISSTACVK